MLDQETLRWIDRLTVTEGLLDHDQCTVIAREIMRELGMGPEQELTHREVLQILHDWPRAEDGLYNLTLSGSNAQVLQHGLVLLKRGPNLVLLQGWSQSFTLGRWLRGQGPVDGPESICFGQFSPACIDQGTPEMRNWLNLLGQIESSYRAGREPFRQICSFLFGARLGNAELLAVREGHEIDLKWKFKRLKDY